MSTFRKKRNLRHEMAYVLIHSGDFLHNSIGPITMEKNQNLHTYIYIAGETGADN